MKFTKEPDGMYTRETWKVTAKELQSDPKARAFFKERMRLLDPYHALAALRTGCEEEWEKLADREGEEVKRSRNDLKNLHEHIVHLEDVMKKRMWKHAVRVAIMVGRLAEKAEVRRQLEPEVILGQRVRGGGAEGNKRAYGTKEKLREKYAEWQRRIDALHKRRPSLRWTPLSEKVGEVVGTT